MLVASSKLQGDWWRHLSGIYSSVTSALGGGVIQLVSLWQIGRKLINAEPLHKENRSFVF